MDSCNNVGEIIMTLGVCLPKTRSERDSARLDKVLLTTGIAGAPKSI